MIFFIDDDTEELKLIEHHLLKNGVKDFKMFINARDFLKEISPSTIVVVIDHDVKDTVTGFDIMKRVLEINPICYPIIVSGNDSPRIIMRYMNNDGFRYVLKNDAGYLDSIVKYIREAQDRIKKVTEYFNNG